MSAFRPHLHGRLKEAYATATRAELLVRVLPDDMGQARAIIDQARALKLNMERQYQDRYQARVRQEGRRVHDEHGGRDRRMMPAWITEDRFDSDFIRDIAEYRVRKRHEARIATVERWETSELRKLARLPARDAAEPIILKQDFDRVRRRGRSRY